jgi:hypothetical protein
MWRGHEGLLYQYIIAMVKEWKRRGYKSTIDSKAKSTIQEFVKLTSSGGKQRPHWMYEKREFDRVVSTHRQALLAKNYEWYSQFGWPEDTGTPTTEYEYYWPI